MFENTDVQLKAIFLYLSCNSYIKKFKFYNSFLKRWKETLKYHYEHDIKYIIKDITDDDQAYSYNHYISNTKLVFNFSIPYIRYLFTKNENFFPKIILKNEKGNLMLNNFKCSYTFYDKVNCNDYNDLENVFVVTFPSNPPNYIVVDGNHRISSQIYNKKEIFARFCNDKIAEKALMSSFEVALYSCLFDCAFIQYNSGRYNDFIIKKNLKIFDKDSFINNINDR